MPKPNRGSGARGESVGPGQHLLEFAVFVHFHHDVRAANELALDVQLGDRRGQLL